MASLSTDAAGRRMVQFVAPDGTRKTLRIGKVAAGIAQTVRHRVDALDNARRFGEPVDAVTLAWLSKISDDFYARLADVGLVVPRSTLTLGEFLDDFAAKRADDRPNTAKGIHRAARLLRDGLGDSRPLASVTADDAAQYRETLAAKFARSTWAKDVKRARQFFTAAVAAGHITANPFAGIKIPAQANPDRAHFVDRPTFARLMASITDPHWRLVLGLCRYGGLRCPTEVLGLRWQDVDWKQARIVVQGHKTAARVMPLFAEIRPLLQVQRELASGSQWVIHRHRAGAANWRAHVLERLHRAGVAPWPRLFQNLRLSRYTELLQSWPIHVVAAWLGNSAAVGMKHYTVCSAEDFTKGALQNAQHESGHSDADAPNAPSAPQQNKRIVKTAVKNRTLRLPPAGSQSSDKPEQSSGKAA